MDTDNNSITNQKDQENASIEETSADDDSKLDFLLDIDVALSIELGTKKMQIKDVLKLGKHSVVELDKAAGDPLDIRANGNLIARGEVVVVNDKYGIRLTEVINKSNRIVDQI